MKVIFLDIDGPLAWATWLDGRETIEPGFRIPYPWLKEECDSLSRIINTTGAEVVLSSDWRHYYNIDQMNSIFRFYGIPSVIIGYTSLYKVKLSSSNQMDRGLQILRSVEQYNPDTWVAIDDYDLSYYFETEGYNNNFIRTRGDHNEDPNSTISSQEQDIINILTTEDYEPIF